MQVLIYHLNRWMRTQPLNSKVRWTWHMSDEDLEFIDERMQKKENANSHLVLRELSRLVEAKHQSKWILPQKKSRIQGLPRKYFIADIADDAKRLTAYPSYDGCVVLSNLGVITVGCFNSCFHSMCSNARNFIWKFGRNFSLKIWPAAPSGPRHQTRSLDMKVHIQYTNNWRICKRQKIWHRKSGTESGLYAAWRRHVRFLFNRFSLFT